MLASSLVWQKPIYVIFEFGPALPGLRPYASLGIVIAELLIRDVVEDASQWTL